MKQGNTRFLPQVTVMNALLCFFVVMIHLTFEPIDKLTVGAWQHIAVFSLNKLLSFCVPAFLFLSGFKLYKHSKVDIMAFYKRRLYKIVLPYIFSALIYILYFYNKGWLDGNFFEYLFFGTISAHFYYVIVTVQIYLLFPFILKLFNRHSAVVTAVSAIMTVICSLYLYSGLWDRFFGQYIFYFVFGMLWKKNNLSGKIKKNMPLIFWTYVAVAVFHIRMMYLSAFSGAEYAHSQIINIVYVLLATVVLYMFSKKVLVKSKIITTASAAVSTVSYSIYLYHCLLIYILQFDVFTNFELTYFKRFMISSIVVYAAIACYSYYGIAKKIPN